jgi:single-strand DNA-binding protein
MSMKVVASGNLTADPTLRFSQNGTAVCSFRIAIYGGKDKPSTFKDCTAFNFLAENFGASMLKGDRAIVSGRMETSKWTGNDGREYSRETIIVEDAGPSLMFMEVENKKKTKEAYTGDNQTSAKPNVEVNEDFPF